MPKLPIRLSPYHAYLHEANTFSVLMAYPQFSGYLNSVFFQLRWAKNWLFTHMPHNIYTGAPFLRTESFYRGSVRNTDFDIIDFITDSVDASMYVAMYVNEQYLPCIGGSLRMHNTFVYGYDHSAGNLHILGYDTRGHYGELTCGFDEFRQAHDFCSDSEYEPGARIARFAIQETDARPLDFHCLRRLIHAYRVGENLDDQISERENFCHEKPAVWGIDCLERVKDYYWQECEKGAYLDIRAAYALFENKQYMLRRLHFIQEQIRTPMLAQPIGVYEEITRQAERIKYAILHYNMTRTRAEFRPERYLSGFSDAIHRIEAAERDVLPELEYLMLCLENACADTGMLRDAR